LFSLPLAVCLVGANGARCADTAIPLGSDGCNHTFARAGHPELVSHCARPSNTPAYLGYLVGGGSPCRGGAPGPLQGTFGWDYSGCRLSPRHVALRWRNRYQGGSGAYKTDSLYVPNVFAIKIEHSEPQDVTHSEPRHHP
jgi:hypothetical protein